QEQSIATPLRAIDIQQCTVLGWPLSAAGLIFAGIGSSPPACTVNPAISGTVKTGNTLSVSTGTWTNGPAFTYQWKKNGVNIGGATANTYTPSNSDRDATFSCDVTGTNASGNAVASATGVGPWLVDSLGAIGLRH